MLGIMTSGCNTLTIFEEASELTFGCEPATEEAYRSWIKDDYGEVSTLIPYVALYDENYLDVKKTTGTKDIQVSKSKKGFVTSDNLVTEEIEYRVDVICNEYLVSYFFVSYEPYCSAGSFLVIPPVFKVTSYSVNELPDETIDGKECFCTEICLSLEVAQDKKVSVISKKIKVKELKEEILINPGISDYVTVEIEEWKESSGVDVEI